MKKLISILAGVVAVAGLAAAQNQLIAQAPTNITVTAKAADSNSTGVVVGSQDMSKIVQIRIVNTGTVTVNYAFGTALGVTNAYAATVSNGIPIAASGSITYDGSHGLPAFPLSAKTTSNGVSSTLVIELLKLRP